MNAFKKILLLIPSGLIFLLAACANVQQIDRGRLSKKTMQIEPMPHQKTFIDEAHSIREGAAGGVDQNAGGGCGCN
ncbi:MAG: DUF4266 domain-containing protein [Deltaproteobacteria bacterium]|nr:DUF4266 domain-containing protein [Deltaproteobacteria bacterium]